jgi:hypothetical protein
MAERAGVIGRVQLRQNLRKFTRETTLGLRKDLLETAKVSAVLAEAAGKDTIWHTPSSLSSQPKDDRVWTGKMVDAFGADVSMTARTVTVRFGWIDTKKRYFLIQEYGGQAFGKTVTPMHAIANADTVVKNYLKSKGIQ